MEFSLREYRNGINEAIHKAGFKAFYMVTNQGDDLLVKVDDNGKDMLPHFDELKIIIDNYVAQLRVAPKKLKVNYSNTITNDILYVSPNFKY